MLISNCEDATLDQLKHPLNSIESRIATGVMAMFAIIGTVDIFLFKERKDRPWIVTYLWIIIDLAITSYLVSQFFEPFAYGEPGIVFSIGFQTYYAGVTLNVVFHWTFANEYLKTVLKMPDILNILKQNSDEQLTRVNWITRGATILFYLAILAWITMNEFF